MNFANYEGTQHQHLTWHAVMRRKNFHFNIRVLDGTPLLHHTNPFLNREWREHSKRLNYKFSIHRIRMNEMSISLLKLSINYCFSLNLIIICFCFRVSSRCDYIRFRSGSTRSYVGCTTEQCNRFVIIMKCGWNNLRSVPFIGMLFQVLFRGSVQMDGAHVIWFRMATSQR